MYESSTSLATFQITSMKLIMDHYISHFVPFEFVAVSILYFLHHSQSTNVFFHVWDTSHLLYAKKIIWWFRIICWCWFYPPCPPFGIIPELPRSYIWGIPEDCSNIKTTLLGKKTAPCWGGLTLTHGRWDRDALLVCRTWMYSIFCMFVCSECERIHDMNASKLAIWWSFSSDSQLSYIMAPVCRVSSTLVICCSNCVEKMHGLTKVIASSKKS